jgi:prevent-host-death family protein
MREIGVRELKANLSSVLHRVDEEREPVRVTRRGRPVVDIVPVTSSRSVEERRRQMIAEGRLTPASRPLPKNPPPPIDTGRSASAIILAEREEER